MSDYDVGYGKPPKSSRFRKGLSGNPKGRPKRQPMAVGDVIMDALNEPVEYREGGRTRKAPRRDLALKRHLTRAVKGDIGSAEALLKLRAQAQRASAATGVKVQVDNWLPDYPEQSGRQKTSELAAQDGAAVSEWWNRTGRAGEVE